MVNEVAWPAGVKTGLIPWELPFHFFNLENGRILEPEKAQNGVLQTSSVMPMIWPHPPKSGRKVGEKWGKCSFLKLL